MADSANWKEREANRKTLGSYALLRLVERSHVSLYWDEDTDALELDGWVTIYPPESSENESGKWEVWVTTFWGGNYHEPPSADSDIHESFTNPQAAIVEAFKLIEDNTFQRQAEAEALDELERSAS